MSPSSKYIHKGCGGEIVNRSCTKCGKHWGPISYNISPNIQRPKNKSSSGPEAFDPDEYRKRIRDRKDINF